MNNETNRTTDIHEISPEALAVLGGGKLAYVKTIRSEDVQKHFPQAPELPLRVAALCAARRRRHADHAHRQPRGGGRECLEQRARDGERALSAAVIPEAAKRLSGTHLSTIADDRWVPALACARPG